MIAPAPTETPAEKARRSRLKRLFNITPEEYDTILEWQGGVCFICERPSGRTRLAVDHRHSDGLVRGLLCWQCNAAVAKLNDDGVRAWRASRYLLLNPPAVKALQEERFGRKGRTTNKSKTRRKRGK